LNKVVDHQLSPAGILFPAGLTCTREDSGRALPAATAACSPPHVEHDTAQDTGAILSTERD
jgi:hypothetical protein